MKLPLQQLWRDAGAVLHIQASTKGVPSVYGTVYV
jgi:hypothetical protein